MPGVTRSEGAARGGAAASVVGWRQFLLRNKAGACDSSRAVASKTVTPAMIARSLMLMLMLMVLLRLLLSAAGAFALGPPPAARCQLATC